MESDIRRIFFPAIFATIILFTASWDGVDGQIWERMPRLCEQIAARETNVWCVTGNKQLWKWVFGIHDWIWVAHDQFKVTNVAVGFDESVWVITEAGETWRLVGNNWTNLSGVPLKQVSSLNAEEAVGVTANDTLYHYTNDTWTELTGAAIWASIGKDGSMWSVTKDGDVQHWTGVDWEKMPRADNNDQLKFIDVYDETRVIATDTHWGVFLWINAGERYLNTEDRGPKWKRLVTQPSPNCEQAAITRTNIYCVSDNQFVNRASSS